MRCASYALVALVTASSALAQTLPPSPTASVGCEPHGDHWHCDGPASTTLTSAAAEATHDHDDDDDDESSGTLPPSPTESVGCHSHGDHWHCDGPAVTSSTVVPSNSTSTSTSAPTSAISPVPTGGSGRFLSNGVALAGCLLLAIGLGL